MKKVGNYITLGIVAVTWIYVLYRFSHVGTIARILMLVILVPFTAKVVYGFLLARAQTKDMSGEDELAEKFTPTVSQPAPKAANGERFCPMCGAKNSANDRFCRSCGRPLE